MHTYTVNKAKYKLIYPLTRNLSSKHHSSNKQQKI